MAASGIKEMKALRDENSRLKQMYAELMHDHKFGTEVRLYAQQWDLLFIEERQHPIVQDITRTAGSSRCKLRGCMPINSCRGPLVRATMGSVVQRRKVTPDRSGYHENRRLKQMYTERMHAHKFVPRFVCTRNNGICC